jgi:hypothetical protein
MLRSLVMLSTIVLRTCSVSTLRCLAYGPTRLVKLWSNKADQTRLVKQGWSNSGQTLTMGRMLRSFVTLSTMFLRTSSVSTYAAEHLVKQGWSNSGQERLVKLWSNSPWPLVTLSTMCLRTSSVATYAAEHLVKLGWSNFVQTCAVKPWSNSPLPGCCAPW